MRHGFVKVAVGTPKVTVAACLENGRKIEEMIADAKRQGVKLLCLPELAVSSATCGDLVYTNEVLSASLEAVRGIAHASEGICVSVGFPFLVCDKVISCAAVISDGEIIGVVCKSGDGLPDTVEILGKTVPFGSDLIFADEDMPDFSFAVELSRTASPFGPAADYCANGARIILSMSSEEELCGASETRVRRLQTASEELCCTYMLASAGTGESTTDKVYSGHNIIAECGEILVQNRFECGLAVSEADVLSIAYKRRKSIDYPKKHNMRKVGFRSEKEQTVLTRRIKTLPFIPDDTEALDEIITLQALGLKKRFEHTRSKRLVIGISGGLDSTLALLASVRCADMLQLPRKTVLAVTMPCFGTTSRTKNNAVTICTELQAELREINIGNSVLSHFDDICHDENVHDVVYENAQARERTQVLMDVANSCSGLVVGTGDLSELALGWATYNGDHISMYGVNAGIPKTLVRRTVEFYADTCSSRELSEALWDILDTPISPELLPADNGSITQKTEDLVGPYELHDFFIWNFLVNGYDAEKMKRTALYAFDGDFDEATVDKWLANFYRRFVTQQFKRSCSPDAVKITKVSLSPRGGLSMPSDASYSVF